MLKPGAADTFYTHVSVSALSKILCAKSRFCTRTENTQVLWGCYEELRHVSFWEERERWEGRGVRGGGEGVLLEVRGSLSLIFLQQRADGFVCGATAT